MLHTLLPLCPKEADPVIWNPGSLPNSWTVLWQLEGKGEALGWGGGEEEPGT